MWRLLCAHRWCRNYGRGKSWCATPSGRTSVQGSAAGCQRRCLPPYSPDRSPIAAAFSNVKALLRRAKARTVAAVEVAIGVALDAITPRDARQYCRHCGYGIAT